MARRRGAPTSPEGVFLEALDSGVIQVEPMTGCWLWTGRMQNYGYGAFIFYGRAFRVHRFSYFLAHGAEGKPCVLHTCDVRCCVNPDHLVAGTDSDNTKDKIRKGRQPIGERCYTAKLTLASVIKIREKRKEGRTLASLGAEFGVSFRTIHEICSGKRWKRALQAEGILNATANA